MSREKKNVGDWGEEQVARYYAAQGFHILERKWRCKKGEIDLICSKSRSLYVVEVKTRRSLLFGNPEEAVTRAKRNRIMRCAAVYLRRASVRYDVIYYQVCSVVIRREQITITLYTDF